MLLIVLNILTEQDFQESNISLIETGNDKQFPNVGFHVPLLCLRRMPLLLDYMVAAGCTVGLGKGQCTYNLPKVLGDWVVS